MIDKELWFRIAQNWTTEDDGTVIPDDVDDEAKKAKNFGNDDLGIVSDDEIDDILADFDFDD